MESGNGRGTLRTRLTIVASPRRSPRVEAEGALAVRRTGVHRVHMICSAATPLGGDVIEARIVVEAGARLHVCSVAASVALPGRFTPVSHATWDLVVEDGGVLVFDPEPTVVAGGADHRSTVRLRVGDDAHAVVRERVQIGRSGEAVGRWSGSLHADSGAGPLLRHRQELGSGSDGHDDLFAPLAAMSTLTWPSSAAAAVHGTADSFLETTMPMAGGGALSTWLGHRLPAIQPARVDPAASDGSLP